LLFLRSPIRDAVETRASRQCHSSRTCVRYKTGRVHHVLAQLKSDPVQVD
jgi:hypothetical protein